MNKQSGAPRIVFLNGEEVSAFDLSGDEAKDLAAARELLAKQGRGARGSVDVTRPEVTFSWLEHVRSEFRLVQQ